MSRRTAVWSWPFHVAVLAGFFAWNLLAANARIAVDIMTPRLRLRPAIVRLPARAELSDVGLVALANLISVTPGTLTLHVDPTERVLYVHVMYAGSPAEARSELQVLQDRLVAAMPWRARPAAGSGAAS